MTRLLLSFAALVALMSVDALAGEQKLTGAEIKAAYSDAKFSFKNSGGTYLQVFEADGTMTVKGVGNSWQDEGKWRVAGDRICRKWKKRTIGVERCFDITRNGNEFKWWHANGIQVNPGSSFTLLK